MELSDNVEPRRISTAAASRYAAPPSTQLPPLPLPARGSPPVPARPRPPPPLPPAGSPAPAPRRPPPRPPITQQPVSLLSATPPAPPQSAVREVIRLDQARTQPRRQNDYVDNPQMATHKPTVHQEPDHHAPVHTAPTGLATLPARRLQSSGPRRAAPAIFSPPQKDKGVAISSDQPDEEHRDSIICSRCGKCKCRACTAPRDCCQPRWICGNQCECSLQKAVEYASCLCCVRCVFYHCFKDSDGQDDRSAADEPCAGLEQRNCCKRWTCLGVLSLLMPCLCLYWPLQGCLQAGTACYNRCSRRGCHCRKEKPANITKRLLIESESSST